MVVAGGSRGIGAGIVQEAVSRGWDVALTYKVRQEAAEAVVAQAVQRAPEARCQAFRLDVRDPRDVERRGDAVLDAFGTVHAVVANAAITHASLAVSTSDEAWQEVIDNEPDGRLLRRPAVPARVPGEPVGSNHLRVVNRRARHAGDAAYCASKAGLLGLSAAHIGVTGGLDWFH
jgi:NAD(P)-dependent dehydrogenase (short-subunit alcohol dehydrogenase family)